MRPLDSPKIWGTDDSGPKQWHKTLSTLPSWLQPHCLLILNQLCRIQVNLQKAKSSLPRRCDSRNLNLSPFCGLDSSSAPLKLQPTVKAAYGSVHASYIQDKTSPMRKEYPIEYMASNEILSILAKVWLHFLTSKPADSQIFYCLRRMTLNTTHMKEILPLSTFSLQTQHCLVSHSFRKWGIYISLDKNPYQNPSLAEFERSLKMTWFDFISSFGGFCGLCLGISFVSVVEILYWFSIRLCRNLAIWIRTSFANIRLDNWTHLK